MSTVSRFKNGIWEGRFQPLHRGHLSYIDLLLDRVEHLWLVVINNETSNAETIKRSPVPDFTQIVDEHHVPDKNPLPFWLRIRVLNETVRAEFGSEAPVTIIGGRRMDLDWSLYEELLPPERCFLTPLRDDFEDAKAKAWQQLGEKVVRVDISELQHISATMVRDAVRVGRVPDELLAQKTIELLDKYQAWEMI